MTSFIERTVSKAAGPGIIIRALLFCLAFSRLCAAAPADPETMPLDVANMLSYKGLQPFVEFQYPVDLKISGDDLYIEQQYMGYMVTLEPGTLEPGRPYFQIVVMLVKSFESAVDAADMNLKELDHYLEPEFAHHAISATVRADGERFSAFAGRGYVAHGVVVADGPLQGLSFSEEFRNFILPGNVDLRVFFKYPTAVQNNESMRSALETILSSLVVHSDLFHLTTDTNINTLRTRK